MITLEIESWKTGLRTVPLIEAVKQHSTGSLVTAKAEVERLLAGETITLHFVTEGEKKSFRTIAETCGAICSTK